MIATVGLPPTNKNLAGLAMTLSHVMGVSTDDTEAMNGLFVLLLHANNLAQKSEEFSGYVPNDMTNLAWQTFIAMMIVELSHADLDNHVGTTLEMEKVFALLKQSVEDLLNHSDMAQNMARIVLAKDIYESGNVYSS